MVKQTQKAGDNSSQLSVSGNLVIQQSSLTVKDVNDIVELHVSNIRAGLTQEASEVATKRVTEFEGKLVNRLNEAGLIDILRNPGYQFNLADASRAVASSDEADTEGFLVELLVGRATNPDNQSVKIAIAKATQIADRLSKETLNGLTATWVGTYLTPMAQTFDAKFTNFIATFLPIINNGLPKGKMWQQDLDALDLIRIEPGIIGRTSFIDITKGKFIEYLSHGINKTEQSELLERLIARYPDLAKVMGEHPLKDGFVILNAKDKEDFESKLQLLNIPLDDEDVVAIISTNQFGAHDGVAVNSLTDKLNSISRFSEYMEWWNSLSAFRFSSPGQVIGYLNARRYINISASISDMFLEPKE